MMPDAGVGITYSADLEQLITNNPQLFQAVEIEPQTLWIEDRRGDKPFRVLNNLFDKLADLPGRKLVHSVGAPVGGTVKPDKRQFDLLKEVTRLLKAPYLSEHLSFNVTHGFNTGFFLPPRQSAGGVQKAVDSINYLRDAIGVPLAFETGVNYFKYRSDEMQDGEFVAAVAEAADCGILLDLHNLFANEINGRQSIEDFLQQIPTERVWEVHLAGGFEMDGFYLDSHSGEMPEPLFETAKKIIGCLPNLKAIIFEIFPSFLPFIGTEIIKKEMRRLHLLWNLRGDSGKSNGKRQKISSFSSATDHDFKPEDWEYTVGTLAVGHSLIEQTPLGSDMQNDPAMPLVQKLIHEFRASMLVAVLPLTSRLIILTLTVDGFMTILQNFWNNYTPKLYASSEAENFIEWLEKLNMKIPSLQKIMEFEKTVLQTLLDEKNRIVKFDFNPFPILQSLSEGKLPDRDAEFGNYEIEITSDFYRDLGEKGNYDFTSSFPYH